MRRYPCARFDNNHSKPGNSCKVGEQGEGHKTLQVTQLAQCGEEGCRQQHSARMTLIQALVGQVALGYEVENNAADAQLNQHQTRFCHFLPHRSYYLLNDFAIRLYTQALHDAAIRVSIRPITKVIASTMRITLDSR